ncbi:type I restriction enzyme HsdR N-terminal domain-containing protein [Pseudoalteromonas sp. APC 3355]|uniref:type I restriction enzyme HsdR N-terminal domain-containing protein n=1 Tax=Pseudoalteromonas sp. APC 3355 TaxID=3035199 RepID=UPI0025B34791|nr:type I restriction enzyme HsdR N-terminal domain-containing protein [Pseudoalteromonas sp. APC 3355]MDN3474366.1 type I restriction enzyme HsdR N-terminal domain-containing protein [Pseudoalteromonas sp. APC 3355]
MEHLITEEDVRTKLVYPWLRSKGFADQDIMLEKNITFQLGRGEFQREKKSGRIDLLIKSAKTGKNLIVFEVKAPEVIIDNHAINQALSYARLIKGNMAPVVVITNAQDTRAYCSLSSNLITELDVKKTITGEFHFQVKELEDLKSEAISNLSKDDYFLKCICRQLSAPELSRLSGKLADSKKYCQELYIPLVEKPDTNAHITLVVGPPQSGKTNYICNSFYEEINEKGFAIFLRAKSIKNGIIQYLKSNIIALNTNAPATELIVNKLLSTEGIKIFIDGLNEVNRHERDNIVDDITRIRNLGVRFVISCTDSFVSTVKYDCNNDFSDVFKNSETNKFCELRLVPLEEYDYENVINHYQKVYETNEKPRQKVSSINTIGKFYYLIKNGAEANELESEYKILTRILDEKCEIISQLEHIDCKYALLHLANSMAESENGVPSTLFCKELSGSAFSALPDSFRNHGILEICAGLIEFYDETYRDIIIIDQFSKILPPKQVLKKLVGLNNSDISLTCVFKYLCFYEVPTSIIFSLDIDIQSKVLESIISYVRNCQLASEYNIRMILDMTINGIKVELISEERAEEVLNFIAEVSIDQPEISIDHNKTQYILGYCSGSIVISSAYEFEEHPYEFYSSQNYGDTIYNYLGFLFNAYVLEDHKIIFNKEYAEDIQLAFKLYGNEALQPLDNFFSNLIEHIFCYDSMMCSFGSYLDVEIQNYRETGEYAELVDAYQILIDMKNLLSNTRSFDSIIEEIDGELKSSPEYEKIQLALD